MTDDKRTSNPDFDDEHDDDHDSGPDFSAELEEDRVVRHDEGREIDLSRSGLGLGDESIHGDEPGIDLAASDSGINLGDSDDEPGIDLTASHSGIGLGEDDDLIDLNGPDSGVLLDQVIEPNPDLTSSDSGISLEGHDDDTPGQTRVVLTPTDEDPDYGFDDDRFDDSDSDVNLIEEGHGTETQHHERTYQTPSEFDAAEEEHYETSPHREEIRIRRRGRNVSIPHSQPFTEEPEMATGRHAAPGAAHDDRGHEDSNASQHQPSRRSIIDKFNDDEPNRSSWIWILWVLGAIVLILVGILISKYVVLPLLNQPAAKVEATPTNPEADPRIAELEELVKERDQQIVDLQKKVAVAEALRAEALKDREDLKLRNHNINGDIEIRSQDGLNHFVQNGQHPDILRLREELQRVQAAAKTKIEEVWGLLRTERSEHRVELQKVRDEYEAKLKAIQSNLDSTKALLNSRKNWEAAYTKASSERDALKRQVVQLQAAKKALEAQLAACTSYTPPPMTIVPAPTVAPLLAPPVVNDCLK